MSSQRKRAGNVAKIEEENTRVERENLQPSTNKRGPNKGWVLIHSTEDEIEVANYETSDEWKRSYCGSNRTERYVVYRCAHTRQKLSRKREADVVNNKANDDDELVDETKESKLCEKEMKIVYSLKVRIYET